MIPEIDFDTPRSSPLDDDIFTFKYITNKRIRDVDLSLFTGKWFDYRHMTPLQATAHYIACYGDIYRRHYAINFDKARSEHVKVDTIATLVEDFDLPAKHAKTKLKFTSYWRGRQMADALGMPYEIYIDLAFEFRMRFWSQRYLPKPGHLYNDLDVDKIEARWQQLQEGRFYKAEHPTYIVQNYENIAHQNDYHEWLFEQANKRMNAPEFIARMIRDDALPVEKVRARLGETFGQIEAFLR